MRIQFFSGNFPHPHAPNRGIFCFRWCHALRQIGHDVRVMSPRAWLEGTATNGLKPLPGLAEFDPAYPIFFYTPRFWRHRYAEFMWISVGRKLMQSVADFRADCVLSYWAHPDGAVAVRAAKMAGIPSAVIVGGSDVLVIVREDARRRRHIATALSQADAVFTVSAHLRQKVMELGVDGGHVHVVYQGVDGETFCPGDKAEARRRLGVDAAEKMLLFVGNLVPVKGVDVLLRACNQLRLSGCAFRLYLLGAGPLRRSLAQLAERLGLGERVRFMGPVAQRDLPDWYRASDVTVLASHSEGIPNVLREALACGTPFVATDVGGIREICQPGMSRLVPANTPDALATALMEALTHPSGRQTVRFASWADSAGQIAGILGQLVERNKAPADGEALCHAPPQSEMASR